MRTAGFGTLLRLSYERTQSLLFNPFSASKWLRLFVIALFAGALTSGACGPGWGGGSKGKRTRSPLPSASAVRNPLPAAKAALGRVRAAARPHAVKILILGAFALLAFLLLLWLNARFEFVWYHSIVNNTAEMAGPLDDYARPGNSLFRFKLAFLAWGFLSSSAVAAWAARTAGAAGLFEASRPWSSGEWAGLFAPHLAAFVANGAALAAAYFCASHFVVAVMALEGATFGKAAVSWAGAAWSRRKDYFLYGLVWAGSRIVSGIMYITLVLILGLGVLLFGAALFGPLYLFLAVWLKARAFFLILLLVFGIPLLLLSLALAFVLQLPFAVFFRCFSLYFLSSLDPGRAPLTLPPVSERSG